MIEIKNMTCKYSGRIIYLTMQTKINSGLYIHHLREINNIMDIAGGENNNQSILVAEKTNKGLTLLLFINTDENVTSMMEKIEKLERFYITNITTTVIEGMEGFTTWEMLCEGLNIHQGQSIREIKNKTN